MDTVGLHSMDILGPILDLNSMPTQHGHTRPLLGLTKFKTYCMGIAHQHNHNK